MRLRQRSSVDFPHPDGPMIAVTDRPGISSVTSPTAWVAPYHAFRRSVRIAGVSTAAGSGLAASGAVVIIGRATVIVIVRSAARAREARDSRPRSPRQG